MVTTLNYAPRSRAARPLQRVLLWISVWGCAGLLPLAVVCGCMLDNFYHQEPQAVTVRYTAYHYICAGIVLWLLAWVIVVVRAARPFARRWRWLACLVAVGWVVTSGERACAFIDLVRTERVSLR